MFVWAFGACGSKLFTRSPLGSVWGASPGRPMLANQFLRVIDWFVPPQARTDEATLGRARIFAFSHIFGPCLGHAISIYLYVADKQRAFPFWVIVGCISAFWTLPFALKLTGRLPTLALLSVINLTFVTLYGSYHYGGVSSPFLPWLLTALLLGFFYLGDRPVQVLSVFGVNIAGFYAAYILSGGFPNHIPLSELSGVGIVSVISATIYVSMMAIYYANVVTSQSVLVREAERHRATAARMRKAMEVSERANQAKSIFLAKMSHQLRTPLNAVIGYSEMLLEDAEDSQDKSQIDDLRRINTAGKHLLSLVTSVLDLSKIEADKTELVIEPFDVASFMDDVIATSRSLVVTNENEFVVERSPDLGIMISDATKLRQSVLNLLSNAGKFTEKGRVTVSVAREKRAGGDWIRIRVDDTGIGIAPDNVQKLFKDFNQADASTASKYGGTGLGLALSQSLCQMMGGAISVESTFGRGSRFTIHVPAYIDDSQQAGLRAEAAEPAAANRNVLSHAG
jgi:signal transduction histidine kinase